MTNRPIDQLKPYEHNPFIADEDGAARVGDNIELLGSKLEPLVAMPDGTLLSGSRRLEIYREKGITEVPCVEVDFYQSEENQLWGVIVEGDKRPAVFDKKEDAMMYVCLACNNQTGHLDKEKFANVEGNFDLDWNAFAFNIEELPSLADLINKVAPQEKQIGYQIIISADTQEEAQTIFNQIQTNGYNAKVKATAKRKK